jgi:hypothetical protein
MTDPAALAQEMREKILQTAFAEKDFLTFCGLLTIEDKNGDRVPFVLNRAQRLYFSRRTACDIILKARQMGFTAVLIALDIFIFLTVPGAKVAIVCQSRQDNKPLEGIVERVNDIFRQLEALGLGKVSHRKGFWRRDGSDATMCVAVAGASPESAKNTLRSERVTHLHCTELTSWQYATETWVALKQCVPPRAKFNSSIVWESTPRGASGIFFEEFRAAQEGRGEFTPHFFPWYLMPEYATPLVPGEEIVPLTDLEKKLKPEQVKWYRTMCEGEGGALTPQEYPCDPDSCFLTEGRNFFDGTKILAMLQGASTYEAKLTYVVNRSCKADRRDLKASGSGTLIPKLRTIRVFHQPEPDREYVVALDPSEGVGLDPSAGIVLERGTGRHMATIWGQFKPGELARVAVWVAKHCNHAEIATERLNHGHAVRVALVNECKYPHIFRDFDKRYGWVNTYQSRTLALDHLEQATRQGHFRTDDVFLLREMKDFIVSETAGGRTRADHGRGKHDDLIMATTIGWSVISRRRIRRDLSNLPPG